MSKISSKAIRVAVTRRIVLVGVLVPSLASCGVPVADAQWGIFSKKPQPTIIIRTAYPGASAQVVADTVAASVERQVNGIEKVSSLRSQCRNDGSYTLTVTFDRGVDPDLAQVLIRNRVILAVPTLPEQVKQQAPIIDRQSPGVLLIASLFSPDASRDSLYLGNYAAIRVRDDLTRLQGVGAVSLLGQEQYAVRVCLDLERMAARGLTVTDVLRAIESQNVQGAAGQAPEEATERLGEIALKTGAEGHVIRLKEVARIELGAGPSRSRALHGGEPAVALAIYPVPQARPQEVTHAVRNKLAELRASCPRGMDLEIAFDFAPSADIVGRSAESSHLLFDLALPAATSPEGSVQVLQRCAGLLRGAQGVQYVLALSQNPFDPSRNQSSILVRLASAERSPHNREKLVEAIRARLGEVPGAVLLLRDPSGTGRLPDFGYGVDLAVHGPEGVQVGDWASKLAERLRRSKKFTDVWARSEHNSRPQLHMDVDRNAAARYGATLADISTTLQVHRGSLQAGNLNTPAGTSRIVIQADVKADDHAEALRRLKVRTAQGELVPLSSLVRVRLVDGPEVIDRLNLRPMAQITANPAPGVSLTQTRAVCEMLAEEARKELKLSPEYQLTWLRELPTSR